MKKILYTICIIAGVLATVSCGKHKPDKLDISGSWELTDIQTKSAQIGSETVSVYLEFTDADFAIYQKIGEGRYRKYTGTYTLTGDVLDGEYSDGKALGSTYKVSLDGESMVLDSAGETDTYTRTEIPASVTGSAIVK